MKSPSYMDSFVSCHIALLIWTKVTFVTFERFFTGMNTLMNIQIWFSTCWKFTEVTFIRTYRTLSKFLNIHFYVMNIWVGSGMEPGIHEPNLVFPVKGSSDPSHFIFEINIGKSRIRHIKTQNRLKMTSFKFTVVLCRIRLFPTLISKMN